MTRADRPHRRWSDRGAAAVEMAIVLPLFLFVVFGVIDFGRMLNAQITLTEAAREGARATVFGESADARVRKVGGCSPSPATCAYTVPTVVSCPASPDTDDDAEVTTRYNFQFVTPLAGIAVLLKGTAGAPVTLTGKGVMPCVG